MQLKNCIQFSLAAKQAPLKLGVEQYSNPHLYIDSIIIDSLTDCTIEKPVIIQTNEYNMVIKLAIYTPAIHLFQ